MSNIATIKTCDLLDQWETLRAQGDTVALRVFIQEHPDLSTECAHDYPYNHRLADVLVDGQPYRVSRCLTCGERLTILPVEPTAADFAFDGVPAWLRGQALKEWVDQEAQFPAKGPIDWEVWRLAAIGQQPHSPSNGEQQRLLASLFGENGAGG